MLNKVEFFIGSIAWSIKIFAGFSALIAFVIVANYKSIDAVAEFGLLLTMLNLAVFLFDSGSSIFALKRCSGNLHKKKYYLIGFIASRSLVIVPFMFLFMLMAKLLQLPFYFLFLPLVASLRATQETLLSFHNASGRFVFPQFVLSLTQGVSVLALGFIFVNHDGDLALLGYGLVQVLGLLLLLNSFNGEIALNGRLSKRLIKGFLSQNASYAVLGVGGILYLSVDTLLLRGLSGNEELSAFQSVFRIVMAVDVLFVILSKLILWKLESNKTKVLLNMEVSKWLFISILLAAVSAALINLFLLEELYRFIYPELEFSAYVKHISVSLSVVVIVRIASHFLGVLMLVNGLEWSRARASLQVALLHVALTTILIIFIGEYGVVFSMPLTSLLMAAIYFKRISRARI